MANGVAVIEVPAQGAAKTGQQALLERMAAHFMELETMHGEWPRAIRTHCEAWDAIMGQALHPTQPVSV